MTIAETFSSPDFILRGISSWEDILELGTDNLRELLKNAKNKRESLLRRASIKKEQSLLLAGRDKEHFIQLAKSYDSPNLEKVGYLSYDGKQTPSGQYLEPLDNDSRYRKSDTTTFNFCGWCKYASGGGCRYQYHIEPTCTLLDKTFSFNTPCELTKLSSRHIGHASGILLEESSALLKSADNVLPGISLLETFLKTSSWKPKLTELRNADYFKVNDKIMFFACLNEDLVPKYSWQPATVVNGYRTYDGCVSMVADFPVTTNGDGVSGGAGVNSPRILHKEEYNFLKNCKDKYFFELWINSIDFKHFDNVPRKEYKRSLVI